MAALTGESTPNNSNANTKHPPMLSYVDENRQIHEIYIAPGKWDEAISYLDGQDWNALSQFPAWSDQPALPPRQADCLVYVDARDGRERQKLMPDDAAARQGAIDMLQNGDWAWLDDNLDDWTGNPPELVERERLHQEGVERMRFAREEASQPQGESG